MHFIAFLLALYIPTTYAYRVEVPQFQQTAFRNNYGIFRWYQGCWFQVRGDMAYMICSPNGRPIDRVPLTSIPDLVRSGILPFDSISRQRSNIRNRYNASRLTAAPGDGIRLSSLFGGGTSENGNFVNNASGNIDTQFSGFRGNTERFRNQLTQNNPFESSGDRFSSNRSSNRFRSGNRNSGVRGNSRFGNGSAGGNGQGLLGRPLGVSCSSIDDTIDRGIFGPIPCTWYPGVFGPKVEY